MSEPGVPPTPPYTPPPPPPAGPSGPTVSPNRSLMIALSYLYLLALIPWLAEKNDPEVQWHAKNGLVLTVAEFVLHIGLTVINIVLSRIAGGFGCAIGLLAWALWVGVFVLRVVCIIKGTSGQRFVIPMLSDYVDRF
jgi:uncharacterized membrane protein